MSYSIAVLKKELDNASIELVNRKKYTESEIAAVGHVYHENMIMDLESRINNLYRSIAVLTVIK